MCSKAGSDSVAITPIDIYPSGQRFVPGSISQPVHLAIGMFDGVHLGHQRVVDEAVQMGKAMGHLSAVLTFDPHPASILRPNAVPEFILSLQKRTEQLLARGLDHILVHSFTAEFSQYEAEDFVPYLQKLLPGLSSLHVGENFRFGAGRRGDGPLLMKSAEFAGMRAHVHPPLCLNGLCLSSSGIRDAIRAGKLEEARVMLGRPYSIEGNIRSGRQIGRRLGFPTINLNWEGKLSPPFGVYSVMCTIPQSDQPLPAIANFGVRPSFAPEEGPVFEVHLLERPECGWPEVGEQLKADLFEFIRPETAFPNAEALRRQIQMDIELVTQRFSQSGVHFGEEDNDS